MFAIMTLLLSNDIIEVGGGFLIFLNALSWEPDFWVTLDDFKVKKKAKLEREICI